MLLSPTLTVSTPQAPLGLGPRTAVSLHVCTALYSLQSSSTPSLTEATLRPLEGAGQGLGSPLYR